MTEAERIFHQDVREKKSIRSSASKTNRTGKGPVRFPSDYLSKKEREKMSGECKSWVFKSFPGRDEFNEMSDDVKIQYLNWLLNTYNVGLMNISKIIFNQSQSTLRNWLDENPEIKKYVNIPKQGFHPKPNDVRRLSEDVAATRTTYKEEVIVEGPIDIYPLVEDNADRPVLNHMEFSMDGFDFEFLKSIAKKFGDQKIHVMVHVNAEKSIDV